MNVNINDIAARIKLVSFSTGKPGFSRLNKKESEEIAKRNGVSKLDAGKAIITHCDHPTLDAMDKLHNEVREYHRSKTQPTIMDAMRLIPFGIEIEHASKMGEYHNRHNQLVRDFMADYPRLAQEAPIWLGTLYDPRPWKPAVQIEAAFRFEVTYLPCPTTGDWAKWLEASVTAAQLELTERLENSIRRVAERCASDGPLYETVFTNLKEVLDLVPDMNLMDDPKIRLIAQQAKALLKDRQRLADKSNRPERQANAREAQRLAAMFSFQQPSNAAA